MSKLKEENIWDKTIRFFGKLWIDKLKPTWSKIRWVRHLNEKSEKVPTVTDTTFSLVVRDVYKNYDWEMDGFSELFDSLRPIPYIYNLYYEKKKKGELFKDDCDGFHSLIYYILEQNGYDCFLVTFVTKPLSKAHTMCVVKKAGAYRLINYSAISEARYRDIQEIADMYNLPVRYWNAQKWDYSKNKFYTVISQN